MKQIVLASTSPFRAELLARLGLAFQSKAPVCDETPLALETAPQLVTRLSRLKAESLTDEFTDALIIGSDQVAVRDGEILGKPGSHDNAVTQLTAASGRTVAFHTGLCVVDTASGVQKCGIENTYVRFRNLTDEQIERYLRAEQPYNCAGSFKSEGLGISLFERISGDDPLALIGLPMIRLCSILDEFGIDVP